MKLIKKVTLIAIATFALAGSTVAFGEDTPPCQKTTTQKMTDGKDVKETGGQAQPAAQVGNTQPGTAPAPAPHTP